MSAYMIALTEVTDPAGMDEYRRRVGPVLAQYGGRPLAAGPPVVLEGELTPHIAVIIEFADLEAARTFYQSAEYQEPKALRHRSARAVATFVEGLPGQ
jgi:uncharacterized protein (DUF1330 family)